jgi:hypothetical protein
LATLDAIWIIYFKPTGDSTLIAISLAQRFQEQLAGALSQEPIRANTCHPSSNWIFVGFDVSDSGQLSGLMNCGYDPSSNELAMARLRWADKLNQNHLFGRGQDATEFCQFAALRTPEHAPLFLLASG